MVTRAPKRVCTGRGTPTREAALTMLTRHRTNPMVSITEPWLCARCSRWHYRWSLTQRPTPRVFLDDVDRDRIGHLELEP